LSKQLRTGRRAAAEALKDQPWIRVMLTAWVISAMRMQPIAENLQQVTTTLADKILPVEDRTRELAALPADEREARLSQLPWTEGRRVRRLIDSLGRPEASKHANQSKRHLRVGPDRQDVGPADP
jgi:hypothetical protein